MERRPAGGVLRVGLYIQQRVVITRQDTHSAVLLADGAEPGSNVEELFVHRILSGLEAHANHPTEPVVACDGGKRDQSTRDESRVIRHVLLSIGAMRVRLMPAGLAASCNTADIQGAPPTTPSRTTTAQ